MIDGCVRVSSILKKLANYGDIDQKILDAKAEIGTDVHNAILHDCSNSFYVTKTQRADAYFESYRLIWKKPPSIQQIPRLFCRDLMITGEIDGLIDSTQLVDWKTSSKPDPKIWEMQAHFYWYLLDVNGYKVSDNMMWVNLRHKAVRDEDGTMIYKPEIPKIVNFTFNENVLSQCIHEANVYWEQLHDALCLT